MVEGSGQLRGGRMLKGGQVLCMKSYHEQYCEPKCQKLFFKKGKRIRHRGRLESGEKLVEGSGHW